MISPENETSFSVGGKGEKMKITRPGDFIVKIKYVLGKKIAGQQMYLHLERQVCC